MEILSKIFFTKVFAQNPGGSGPSSGNPVSGGTGGGGFSLSNPLKVENLSEFIEVLLNIVVVIAFPLVVLALVYSGFLFVMAQGNDSKLEQARKVFLWTIVGAVIVLGVFVIREVIVATVDQFR